MRTHFACEIHKNYAPLWIPCYSVHQTRWTDRKLKALAISNQGKMTLLKVAQFPPNTSVSGWRLFQVVDKNPGISRMLAWFPGKAGGSSYKRCGEGPWKICLSKQLFWSCITALTKICFLYLSLVTGFPVLATWQQDSAHFVFALVIGAWMNRSSMH